MKICCIALVGRRSRGDPVRRRRHSGDGAGEQHKLVRRLLHPHGRLPGHEPLHRPRRAGHRPLRRRHLQRTAARAHPRVPHARPRALHGPAAALAAGGGHGLLPLLFAPPGAGERARVVAGISLLGPQAKASAAHLAPADAAGAAPPGASYFESSSSSCYSAAAAAGAAAGHGLHIRVGGCSFLTN